MTGCGLAKIPRRGNLFFVPLFLALAPGRVDLRGSNSLDYAPYARLLRNSVTEGGLVHYARLREDRADLDAFVLELAQVSPENSPQTFPTRADQLAYWINAYNALVLQAVADRYPIQSVKDVALWNGFFWRLKFPVGGREYTLNQIEHDILRPRFRDPRVHFALNCASSSCPRLAKEPYLPGQLEQQLDQAARFFIQETRNVQPDPSNKRISLSMIFHWYRKDFTGSVSESQRKANPSVLNYIRVYATPELKAYIETRSPAIRYVEYDWSLNDAGR